MEIKELYDHLKEAYTTENLGLISGRIIDLFRDHKYDALRAVQKVVNEYLPVEEEKINRIFSRLIMIYHPDRLNPSVMEIDKAYLKGDFETLFSMSHILTVQNMEPELVTVSSMITDEDLAEEFGWDEGADGTSYFMAEEDPQEDVEEESDYAGRSFLSVLKRRVYGNLNVDFPMYLVEDLEEIEMADYDIEFLDGIDACHYARAVDPA